MEENSNKENETQAKPYVIANPVDGGRGPSVSSVINEVKEEILDVPSNETPSEASPSEVRYNAVTGEDMNMSELIKKDDGAIDNTEKLKTIEVNASNNNPMSAIMMLLFFVFLIVFVVFLPNIQAMIAEYKARDKVEPEIVNGVLECELTDHTMNLDTKYERNFTFEDKKVKKAKFTTTYRGDASKDEEILDNLNVKCNQVSSNVDNLSGISVNCTNEAGKVIESESFDYASYDVDEVSAAYAEAGADFPEFEYDQDIERIETMMNRSGFTCKIKDTGSNK